MTATQASVLGSLRDLRRPVFTTRDIAALSGVSVSSASQLLKRLAGNGLVVRARKGLWCMPKEPRFSQFSLVPYLCGEHQAYVSLVSALYLHGMVEQIPVVVHAITTGHTRSMATPIATYSFHQVNADFFDGFQWYGKSSAFLCATPEKALVDSLYLSLRKGKRFGHFPELTLPRNFRKRRAYEWCRKIRDRRIQKRASDKLNHILSLTPTPRERLS